MTKDMWGHGIDLKELRRRQACGHRYVQVVVRRDRRPRTHRIRVMPGVLGVYIGETGHIGEHMADVLIADMVKALENESEEPTDKAP